MGIELQPDKEFPIDCTPEGIVVLPVNLQGILDLTKAGRRFKWTYPKIVKQYLKDCIQGEVYTGQVKFYTEMGQEVALLFYKNYEIGVQRKTESLRYDAQLVMCLRALFRQRPNTKLFYSAPLVGNGDLSKKVLLEECGTDIKWIVMED